MKLDDVKILIEGFGDKECDGDGGREQAAEYYASQFWAFLKSKGYIIATKPQIKQWAIGEFPPVDKIDAETEDGAYCSGIYEGYDRTKQCFTANINNS